MLQVPSGFNATQKTPLVAVGIEFATAPQAIAGAKRILLLGHKTSAGTMAADTPTVLYSLDDARAKAGIRSQLAQMSARVFAQRSNANLYACAVPENGSAVAATGTLLFATNASSAGVVRLWFRGRPLAEVTVNSGDTPTTIAAAVNAAFNKRSDWPATSGVSTGTVTLTASNGGPQGNQLTVRCEITAGGTTVALNGGAAAKSVDGKLGTGTATAGSGAPSITDSLTAIAASRYDLIVCAFSDGTNVGLLRTHLAARFAIGERIRQQGVIAYAGSLSASKTLADAQNHVLLRAAWLYNAEEPEAEVAAAHAAACLYGDAIVGGGIGKSTGEEADCAANLNGTMLADILTPHLEADCPTPTEAEDALNNGLTPLVPSSANPGFVEILRSVTMRFKDSSGNPTFDTLDTSIPATLIECADRIETTLRRKFPNKKLRPNPANLQGPTVPNTVFPYMLEREIFSVLLAMEAEGKLVSVAASRSQVKVEQSTVTSTLVIGQVPASVIPIFNAAAIRLLQGSPFFSAV